MPQHFLLPISRKVDRNFSAFLHVLRHPVLRKQLQSEVKKAPADPYVKQLIKMVSDKRLIADARTLRQRRASGEPRAQLEQSARNVERYIESNYAEALAALRKYQSLLPKNRKVPEVAAVESTVYIVIDPCFNVSCEAGGTLDVAIAIAVEVAGLSVTR